MSSDNRFRPPERSRRVRRPDDQEQQQSGRFSESHRDPRRRTSFVPRQGSGRAIQPPSSRPTRQRDAREPEREPRQPVRPPTRRPQNEEVEPYGGPDDEQDDELLDVGNGYAQPTDRQARGQRGADELRNNRPPRPADGLGGESDADDGYGDRYDDSFIDEDDWYEEEAAAGAYRPRRPSSKRGSGSRGRRPAISRPNIPRPVMPARIKEAALIQDSRALIMLAALVVSAAVMALVTMNQIDDLAPGFATRVSASGLPEAIRSESALWQLPLMAGVLVLMNAVGAWFLSPHSEFSARFLLATSILVQILIWVALFRIAF